MQRKLTLLPSFHQTQDIDLRWHLCFQRQTFGRTPASHVPTSNSHSRGYRNNDSYLSDTLVLSLNTMYSTDDDRRLRKH